MNLLHNHFVSVALTLHVSDQQIALSVLVDPVLESAALLPRLRVTSHQVDLFAVLDWIFDKVTDQLLFQCGIGDVVGRTVNQVDGNDPGVHMRERDTIYKRMNELFLGLMSLSLTPGRLQRPQRTEQQRCRPWCTPLLCSGPDTPIEQRWKIKT